MHQKRKVILDVDTGTDDAVAILMAGHAASLDLVAVTVTYGNGPLELTLCNTLKVVEAGGLAHVPVFAGASRPLTREPYPTQGLQRTELPLPEPSVAPGAGRAADFLRRYYGATFNPLWCYGRWCIHSLKCSAGG